MALSPRFVLHAFKFPGFIPSVHNEHSYCVSLLLITAAVPRDTRQLFFSFVKKTYSLLLSVLLKFKY